MTQQPDLAAAALRIVIDDLDQLATLIDALDDHATDLKLIDDFDILLGVLYAGDQLTRRVREVVGGIHDRAWAQRGEVFGNHHHPSLGVVSVRRTAKRDRWDHPGTAARVVDAHMAESGGEIPPPSEVAAWLLDAGALSYWRKGKLVELGIDADGEDLHWKEPGTPTITFPSG